MKKEDAKEWLSNRGYGSGTNLTIDTVAHLLTDFASQQKPEIAWLGPDIKPESEKTVLAIIESGKYPVRVMWVKEYSISTEDWEFHGAEDYNESDDKYYWPEGWYEWNEMEEVHWMCKDVLFWTELPVYDIQELKSREFKLIDELLISKKQVSEKSFAEEAEDMLGQEVYDLQKEIEIWKNDYKELAIRTNLTFPSDPMEEIWFNQGTDHSKSDFFTRFNKIIEALNK